MTSFEVVTLFTSIVAILLSITWLITQYVVDSKNKKPKPFLRTRKIEVKLPEKINLDWGSEEDTPDYHSVFSISLSNWTWTALYATVRFVQVNRL